MRYHLHVAEQIGGATTFQTQEAATEQEAAATATMLARRGLVVWLHEHDHNTDLYQELGMFIDNRFLPARIDNGCHNNQPKPR